MQFDQVAAELTRRADAAMNARRASMDDPVEKARLSKLLLEALEELVMWTKYGKTAAQ